MQTRVARELGAVVVRDAGPAPAGSGESIANWAPTLSSAVLSGMMAAMRNLVFLSTSVCRLQPAPMTLSASQWPNVSQSPVPNGRSRIGVRPGIAKRDALRPPRLCLRR